MVNFFETVIPLRKFKKRFTHNRFKMTTAAATNQLTHPQVIQIRQNHLLHLRIGDSSMLMKKKLWKKRAMNHPHLKMK